MAPQDFTGIFNPSKTKHPVKSSGLGQFLTLGALGQITLLAILPSQYALLPVIALLLHSMTTIVLQSVSPSQNTYAQGVVYGRSSAQLPAPGYESGKQGSVFGSKPAAQGIVVLFLGFRVNTPLGVLSTGYIDFVGQFKNCSDQLASCAEDFGCIGSSNWTADEGSNNNTIMTVFYFRDIEGLNRFAHDKVHRAAWDWYNNFCKKHGYKHIGIFHETYYSAPGQYETIYVNMPPLLFGATNVKSRNQATGEEEWIRPVVDAENMALRSQWGRMGRAIRDETED
ncbi:hypothetical protein BGZ63DRAFT_435582 [Mariannaea sp. PMI_226]|nr:hypothetical protein BGZ63DRAFT_435582 [Mariannaea sp. PMI_226]